MIKTAVIENNIWCELKTESNKCMYTFYPSNIPVAYGGSENANAVSGTIVCDSENDADKCLNTIAALIENGYSDTSNWYIALDMKDVLSHIFNGENLRYLSGTMDNVHVFPQDAEMVFAYFRMPKNTQDISAINSIAEQLSAKELWQQLSYASQDTCTADVWYR